MTEGMSENLIGSILSGRRAPAVPGSAAPAAPRRESETEPATTPQTPGEETEPATTPQTPGEEADARDGREALSDREPAGARPAGSAADVPVEEPARRRRPGAPAKRKITVMLSPEQSEALDAIILERKLSGEDARRCTTGAVLSEAITEAIAANASTGPSESGAVVRAARLPFDVWADGIRHVSSRHAAGERGLNLSAVARAGIDLLVARGVGR